MTKFSGALTMGLIIAATTGLVATYAFGADNNAAGSSAPAQVQSAPADNNANSANPSNTNGSGNAANSGNAMDKDKSSSQAATPDANADKPSNANNTDMNKSDTNQTGQAATPDMNDQSAQSQAPQKKHMAMSRHHIEVIQAALANSGQNVEVDGFWGPKTARALKDFQKTHGLKATGHLDHKTRQALPLPPKSS